MAEEDDFVAWVIRAPFEELVAESECFGAVHERPGGGEPGDWVLDWLFLQPLLRLWFPVLLLIPGDGFGGLFGLFGLFGLCAVVGEAIDGDFALA